MFKAFKLPLTREFCEAHTEGVVSVEEPKTLQSALFSLPGWL